MLIQQARDKKKTLVTCPIYVQMHLPIANWPSPALKHVYIGAKFLLLLITISDLNMKLFPNTKFNYTTNHSNSPISNA